VGLECAISERQSLGLGHELTLVALHGPLDDTPPGTDVTTRPIIGCRTTPSARLHGVRNSTTTADQASVVHRNSRQNDLFHSNRAAQSEKGVASNRHGTDTIPATRVSFLVNSAGKSIVRSARVGRSYFLAGRGVKWRASPAIRGSHVTNWNERIVLLSAEPNRQPGLNGRTLEAPRRTGRTTAEPWSRRTTEHIGRQYNAGQRERCGCEPDASPCNGRSTPREAVAPSPARQARVADSVRGTVCALSSVGTQASSTPIFPTTTRNALYTYSGFLTAATAFPDVRHNTGNLDTVPQRSGAFLCELAREPSPPVRRTIHKRSYCSTRNGCAATRHARSEQGYYGARSPAN